MKSSADTEFPPQAPPRDTLRLLRWPVAIAVTLIALATLALVAYLQTLQRASQGVEAMGDAAGAVARGAGAVASTFFSGDVTESFISSMPEIDRSGSGRLEVASAVITETVTRTDERRMLWDILSLGTTTVEIQVPVTYRYHVPVDGEWRLEVRGPVCLVLAPPLAPTLPPAIHTDGLRTRTEESLLRFDAGEQMADLQRSLTPRLSQRAASEQYRRLVRESARGAVADFVRTWLLRQDYWADDRFSTIKVVFADEPEAEAQAGGLTAETPLD